MSNNKVLTGIALECTQLQKQALSAAYEKNEYVKKMSDEEREEYGIQLAFLALSKAFEILGPCGVEALYNDFKNITDKAIEKTRKLNDTQDQPVPDNVH